MFKDTDDDALDTRLRGLLAPVHVSSGDTFIALVMRRVRRRAWARRSVLGAAVILGAAIAFSPLAELSTAVGTWLGKQAGSIDPLTAVDLTVRTSVALLLTCLCAGGYRWLTR